MATGIHRAVEQKSITTGSAPTGPIAVIKDVGKFLYRNEFARYLSFFHLVELSLELCVLVRTLRLNGCLWIPFCRATARDVGLFVASIAFVWFLDKELFNYVPPPES